MKIKTDKELVNRIANSVMMLGGHTYYVGGYVRDKITGKKNKDIDIEVHNISPERLKKVLSWYGELDTIGNQFGIYNIHGYDIDIALPRKEKAIGAGHKDFEIDVDPYCGVEAAARRRDFTINAIYEDIILNTYIDPFHGIEDIKAGIIRHVDKDSFIEDPLRVLRACQFASRFEFKIDEGTNSLMKTMSLSSLPKERIYGELKKALLKSKKPSIFFDTLYETGHTEWFKELYDLKGIEQNHIYHPEGSAYTHTMMVIDNAVEIIHTDNSIKNPEVFMLSALCHDFGKAISSTRGEDGIWHNYGHAETGVEPTKTFLNRITNNKNLIRDVVCLVENHMRPVEYARSNVKNRKTNELFDKMNNDLAYDLIMLSRADYLGRTFSSEQMKVEKKEEITRYNTFMLDRLQHYNSLFLSTNQITGSDLIKLGLTPGKDFSEILETAHSLWLAEVPSKQILKQVANIINNPVLKRVLKEKEEMITDEEMDRL